MSNFLSVFMNLFIDMSFYMMIGFLMAGAMHVLISEEMIIRHGGKNNFSSTVKASLLGVPLPLCSCGVIPMAAHLKRKGASDASVVSFLTSTPQTGLDSIFATYGLLGPFMAVFRPVAAFLSGVIGGSIVSVFKSKTKDLPPKTSCGCTSHKTSKKRLSAMFKYGFVDLMDDISVHFLIGLVVASFITILIPEDLIIRLNLTKGIVPMLVMVLLGAPMYICSTSSIPIALSLMVKGLSPGAAFVFLFMGPVTNAASLSVIFKVFSKKTGLIYLLSAALSSLSFGLLLEWIFSRFNPFINTQIRESVSHTPAGILKYIVAAIFLYLLISSLYKKILNKFRKKEECCSGCSDH